MSASCSNSSKQGNADIAQVTQERALFSKRFPNHPLGRASDFDFQAALASAKTFAAEVGPIEAFQIWLNSSTEVTALFAVAAQIAPVVTVVTFLYGFYKDWQQKKEDKETAKKIIREIIAAVDQMINRAVEGIEEFIKDEQIKLQLDSFRGLQTTLADLMSISADNDFADIDNVLVGSLIRDCNQLLAFFERTMNESVEASNSALAAIMFEHLTNATQLKNQTLAWQDKTIPHGTSSVAKQGVLKLQEHLDVLLTAVRKTTDKQFSQVMFREVLLDGEGRLIRPRPGQPELEVVTRFDVFFYYFQGVVQGDLLSMGTAEAVFFGGTDQAEVGMETERRKEEEYLKASKELRALGEENKKALIDLDNLIQEEST